MSTAETRAAVNRYLRAYREYRRLTPIVQKVVDETATEAEWQALVAAGTELGDACRDVPDHIDLDALPAFEELS